MNVQARMVFIGVIRDLQPSVQDIPTGPHTEEKRNFLKRGTLYWAGEGFERPGLYMWTGEAHVLIESKTNLEVKVEAGVTDPNGPGAGEEE